MSSSAQEFWDRLPIAEQQRRLAYYDRTARQAHSHCCSVLIGCPLQPTHEARSATGTLLRLEEQHFLITANHVLDGFAKKSEAGPAHFQAGGLVINPWARLVHQDTANDLAVLAIDEKDVPSIGCTPYEPVGSWPPDCPQDHDFVHLCGFAGANRLNGLAGTIENVSLHLFGQVMTSHDGNFYAQIDRTGIPTDNAHLMPPPGESLGGMSGGPVMLYFAEPLPLVSIVSEMSHLMDAIRVTSLSKWPLPKTKIISIPRAE